jgi:hypothetical protein
VFDKFVPIGRCKAFFDFANTPLVVAIELAYELRRKVDFHATSLEV